MSRDLFDNPLGTDGFEFVEFTSPEPERLQRLFEMMGFVAVAQAPLEERAAVRPGRHQLHPQHGAGRPAGGVPRRARAFGQRDGVPGQGRGQALKLAVERGAKAVTGPVGPMELNIPAIEGIGGSNLYLVDRYGAEAIYDVDFVPDRGRADARGGPRPHLSRPPDPQRAPRPDGPLGRTSTSASSISARSATSTSRARRPASSPRR